ncbi:hypothetical protein LOD99_9433 [Oopsacas minuta]|uniref:Uncharacterized protein n=1 Tax=Oopsacas minuta TaxID=111878 RepID=A0AAV7JCH1_9METZ|nr:hypothetical protein LOD99_9433 [Oopsacas minuta]
MANAGWTILWFIIFIVIGWWIGNFCAGWFVLISPCWVCIDALTPVIKFLWIGTCFPILNAKYIKEGRDSFPGYGDLTKDLGMMFKDLISPF